MHVCIFVCKCAFFCFILHDNLLWVTVCAYSLELFQVKDLRNNLNTINDAAREVSLRFLS